MKTAKRWGKWLLPIGITVGGGVLWLFGWLGQRAMMGEFEKAFKAAIAPIPKDVGEIKKGQNEIKGAWIRVKVQQDYQAEQIREIKKKLE